MPDPWKGDMRGAGQPGESPNMNSLPLQQLQLYPSSGAPRSRLLPFQAECLAGTLLHVPCPGAPPALCLPRCLLIAAVHHDSLLLSSSFFLPCLKKIPLKTTFLSRVCVFLPFQPFLPTLQYFQSLTFSSRGSVFQSQAAEQAQGVTSTPPAKQPAAAGYPQFWGSLLPAHGTLHIFSS